MKWLYLSLLNKIILSEELREDRNWTSLKQTRTEGKWHMASRRCYSLIPSALKKVTSFPWTLDVSHRDCQQSVLDRNSPWKTLKTSVIPRASICNEATVTTIEYVVRWFYHKVQTHVVCPIFCWKTPHICSEGIKNFRCLTQKSRCLVFMAYLGIYIPQCRKRSDAVCISISSASTKMVEVQSHFNGMTGINNMQNVSPFTLGETMVHRERSVCAVSQTKSTMNTFRKIKIKSSSCLMHASIHITFPYLVVQLTGNHIYILTDFHLCALMRRAQVLQLDINGWTSSLNSWAGSSFHFEQINEASWRMTNLSWPFAFIYLFFTQQQMTH